MQLIKKTLRIIIILSLISVSINAQNEETQKENDDPVEVDFLFNYYEQDGNHSAVDGGKGSQELTDWGPQIIINIPMENSNILNLNFGVDTYSSASSDNIDPTTVSGASKGDSRAHIDADYIFNNPLGNSTYGITFGASVEYDYKSLSLGGHWAKTFDDGNKEISFTGKVFFDNVTLIYPFELREKLNPGKDAFDYDTDSRNTFSFSTNYSFVVSKDIQAAVSLDLTYQTGYLSTPFQRVYFMNESTARIEKLPDSRIKIPLGFRLNYFLSDFIVTRFNYRFYYDDFGITGNTFNMEIPLRLNNEISFTPFYRFHTQTGADYFKPKGEFISSDEFYTSDYDLSSFDSHQIGIGFKYYPVWGIGETGLPFMDSKLEIKRFDVRFASYNRSDGLDAYNISFGVGFLIK